MASKKNNTVENNEPRSGGEKSVHSLRMAEETYDGIQAAKQAMEASSMDETLKSIMESYFLTAAEKDFPERSEEIKGFEYHCRRLIDTYIQSLRFCADAKARAEEEVKTLLESKDSTIMELQEKVKTQSNEINQLHNELKQAYSERDAAISEAEALKEAGTANATLINHLDMLRQLIEANLDAKMDSPDQT